MSVTRQAIVKNLLVLALLWGFNCCTYPNKRAEPQPPKPPPVIVESAPEFIWEIPAKKVLPPSSNPKPRPYIHKVRWSGEILISIAKWYTGSRNNWTAIAKANPHLNPNRIFIGDNILIPGKLLKRRDPMPQNFLITSSRKKPAQTPPPKQLFEESNTIELFEPIE